MAKKKKKNTLELQVQINKKDNVGLFINFPSQTFSTTNRRDREKKNTRQLLNETDNWKLHTKIWWWLWTEWNFVQFNVGFILQTRPLAFAPRVWKIIGQRKNRNRENLFQQITRTKDRRFGIWSFGKSNTAALFGHL